MDTIIGFNLLKKDLKKNKLIIRPKINEFSADFSLRKKTKKRILRKLKKKNR